VDLARRHGSFVTALYMREWSPAQLTHRRTAELAGQSLAEIEALDRAVEGSIAQSELERRSQLELLAAQYQIQAEWRAIENGPMALPQHARYADLCVLDAGMPAASTSAGYGFSEEMLFTAGRPVLLVPTTGQFSVLGGHVAVAWNSSRAAARALNDALPLLERSEQTTVIAINPGDFLAQHGALPLPSLIDHLRRHGISAKVVELADVAADAVADRLQETALAAGADMIVAGAHGHTWLREMMLGSVTRDLLSRLRLPVMMSH
jgi:nucleotide-binding universal stress UspA family protein